MPTNGIVSRLKAAVSGFRFPSTVTHAGTGSFLSIAPRTFPYWNTDPLSNSAVVNVLDWITRNFGQAELTVTRDNADGEDEIIDNHPMVDLLNRPNPYYGGYTLWSGVLTSYFLDGNAYILKERNARGFGVPTALWYEPHWSIRPHWPDDGSEFIDYYERRINGAIQKIPKENVIHFRKGINPSSPRYGLSPLKAALLQVFTDNEVSMWVAALARNMAIPGVVVSPTENIGMSPEKAEQIKQVWKRKFGGDNRGEPLILDFQATVEVLGFDPKQMDFAAINHLAETRIAGAFGIPAIVAGLGAGLDASTYNNLENLKKSAFEECLVPTWEAFEDELDTQLLPDFERDPQARGIETEFDTSEVKALRENQTELEKRVITAFQAGVITLNETRRQLSYDLDPDGDYYLLPTNARPIVASVAMARAEQEITDPAPAQLPGQPPPEAPKLLPASFFFQKGFNWQGLDLRREPTLLEAGCIKQIAEAMAKGQMTTEAQLMRLRERFIDESIAEIDDLDPDEFYRLTVNVTDTDRNRLSAVLQSVFIRGAQLVREELRRQGAKSFDDGIITPNDDEFDEVAGVIAGRVANDVQARAIGSATQAVLLGAEIARRIRDDFAGGSTAYIRRGAAEASNTALAYGRSAQMDRDSQVIDYLVYSAVLDNNTCEPCGESDGLSGQLDDIPPAPNPACLGGAQCRCVHIPVVGNLEPMEESRPVEPTPPPAPEPVPVAIVEEIVTGDTGASARERLAGVTAQYARESAERAGQRQSLVNEFVLATSKKERNRLEKLVKVIDQEQAKAQLSLLDQYRGVLYQSASAQFEAPWVSLLGRDITELVPLDVRQRAAEGVEAFKRLVGDHPALQGAKIELRYTPGVRAFYQLGYNNIELGDWDDRFVMVHELGHWLENKSPSILEKVKEFYATRTAGEELIKLSDIFPLRGYDDDEVTKVDRWVVPYVGKWYGPLGGNPRQVATEILSVGLEWFYKDPMGLAQVDPEFFDFIYEVIRLR